MTTYKFSNGAFVFYRTSTACQPMHAQTIEIYVNKHNMPNSMIPEYAGDRAIVSRSIAHVQPKVGREHWLLRPIRQTSTELVYGIVYENKDSANETLSHSTESRLRWTSENGNGVHVEGDHHVAQAVDATYQQWRGLIMPQDWALAITNYLLNDCHGQAMREDGRNYWIPPQHLTALYQLKTFLADIGIDLVISEVSAENVQVSQQAASEGLAEQIAALEKEVQTFDGKQKPSTYKSRLEEYQSLRRRAMTYRDALGIGVEKAQAILDTLEQQVQDMLTLRESVVLKRNGTEERRGIRRGTRKEHSAEEIDADILAYPPEDNAASTADIDTALAHAPIVGEFAGLPVVHIPEVTEQRTPENAVIPATLQEDDPLARVMEAKIAEHQAQLVEKMVVEHCVKPVSALERQLTIPMSW